MTNSPPPWHQVISGHENCTQSSQGNMSYACERCYIMLCLRGRWWWWRYYQRSTIRRKRGYDKFLPLTRHQSILRNPNTKGMCTAIERLLLCSDSFVMIIFPIYKTHKKRGIVQKPKLLLLSHCEVVSSSRIGGREERRGIVLSSYISVSMVALIFIHFVRNVS